MKMARRSFRLVKDVETHFDSNKNEEEIEVKWSECIICQERSKEKLIGPVSSNHNLDLQQQYSKLVQDLKRFETVESLSLPLKDILGIENLECKCAAKKAVYHKRCRNQYDDYHYERKLKRTKRSEEQNDPGPSTKTRSHFEATNFQKVCFLCSQLSDEPLSIARTLQLHERVRYSAERLLDEKLLAKLSEGDLVATEAKYHKICLAKLYNKVRALDATKSTEDQKNALLEGITIAEVEQYMRHCIEVESDTVPVFYLKELKNLYSKRIAFHGGDPNYEHSTRFKEKILKRIPELTEHKVGRDVILTLKEGSGEAIFQSCDLQDDGMCLTRAAEIIRKEILRHSDEKGKERKEITTETFNRNSEKASVSKPVLSFMEMVLHGSDIVNDANKESDAALTISQLIHFNTKKKQRRTSSNETPFPLYQGLMIHSKTRKKGIIEELSGHGLSVSYKRVLEIQTEKTQQLCKLYDNKRSVCPPKLQKDLFTVAAIDNLDHNPSSSTATNAFHGTGISIFQYPVNENQVVETELPENYHDVKIGLPPYYTTVKPTRSQPSSLRVSTTNPLDSVDIDLLAESKDWLQYLQHIKEEEIEHKINWSSFWSNQAVYPVPKSISTMLPLLNEEIATHAMVRHSMDIIKEVHRNLNLKQLVITADQPVYALGKKVQWLYPDEYGEDKILMMMGPLHIEMALLSLIGDWLESSGWVETLVKANISTPGKAESFLKGSHPKRSRYAHQVTCSSLSLLMNESHENSNHHGDLTAWVNCQKSKSIQFFYWNTVFELELMLLAFVKSLRTGDFPMFLACLEKIAVWMFTMDHVHYARWLPVFINDLKALPTKHPKVYQEFLGGKFTINQTGKPFSNIGIDQAHEQNNKLVKIDGGAVDILLNDNTALMKWMVAGPEIAEMVNSFRSQESEDKEKKHHEDTLAFEKRFRKDVKAFCNALKELGNPFDDTDDKLLHLVSKTIMDDKAVGSVKCAASIGETQYKEFVEKRLVRCEVPIYEKIPKNKLVLFREKVTVCSSKGKMKTASMKEEKNLYASLFVACQSRSSNLAEFFKHENHNYPPAISEYGKIRKTNKSDFLLCLEECSSSSLTAPQCTAKVIDGAASVQTLKPNTSKTFGEYAVNEFTSSVLRCLNEESITRVDVVFDRYFPVSLKGETRERRGSGLRVSVKENTPIVRDWAKFLKEASNKDPFFNLLAEKVTANRNDGKTVISTKGEHVIASLPIDTSDLAPCNHEEADTRMFLHLKNVSAAGHQKVSIKTVDTDVVVIAIGLYYQLDLEELWVEFGNGVHLRWLPVHEYASKLGEKVCKALPVWFAFTGCDTVSGFHGRGKKMTWNTLKSYHTVTDTFARLASLRRPEHLDESDMTTIERYVVLMYDRGSGLESVNECRRYLFTRKNRASDNLPPTYDALVQHVKRAICQGGLIWCSSLRKTLEFDPNEWGWKSTQEGISPIWMTIPEAAKSCRELIKCGCKGECTRCKCKRHNLMCTELCNCSGNCTNL